MLQTFEQVDQRFAFIAQPFGDDVIYFQILKYGPPLDWEGNPLINPDTGLPFPDAPYEWDEAATTAEYNAWKIENDLGRAAN